MVNVTPLNAYHMNEMEYKGKKRLLPLFDLKSNNNYDQATLNFLRYLVLVRLTVTLVRPSDAHPSMDIGKIRFVC